MPVRSLSLVAAAVALVAALAMRAPAASAGDGCGDFQPLSGTIAGMKLVNHTVFADRGLGAAISFAGDDGIVTYYRYDLGYTGISESTLRLATQRSVEEMSLAILLLKGEITGIRQSGKTRLVNEVEVTDVVVIGRQGSAATVSILGMGSDGHCLHKVRYTPNMAGIGEDGRNADGLLAFQRFERVLDDLAVYFCRESCLTEL